MIKQASELLRCTKFMPLALAFIAAASLVIALMAQYIFELAPCILCVVQSYPYGIVIALGVIGYVIADKSTKWACILMTLTGFTFLANSVIAFYHTGVEQKWWPSHLEGCAIPDLGSDPSNILAILENTAPARCDEIPWSDPILNLSMANYNVVFCLGLGLIAFYSAYLILKKN